MGTKFCNCAARLCNWCAWGGYAPAIASILRAKIFILVIAAGDRKLGLIVDALEGEEELVIKAVDDQTVDTDLVSGASILGDGRVVLILNLAAVVERSNRAAQSSTETRASRTPAFARRARPAGHRICGGAQ